MCILGGRIFEVQILDPILIFNRASSEVKMDTILDWTMEKFRAQGVRHFVL